MSGAARRLAARPARRPAEEAGAMLLVSSSGGHLTELAVLADRWGLTAGPHHWVVPRTPQTESALAGHRVTWVPPVGSRDLAKALRNVASADRLHRRLRPSLVATAGAAQAVPHLLTAAAHRTPIVYVESAARLSGPSVTGRLAAGLPGSRIYSQAGPWGGRWELTPDVFSCFAAIAAHAVARVDSVVVMLGTERFGFPRAVRAVLGAVPPDVPVTWQVGSTSWPGPSGELTRWLPATELAACVRRASVVVSHGGAGSVLTALAEGRVPVVLPRAARLGEHVDDHQVAMCEMLAERGLVVLVEPGRPLTADHLVRAARLCAVPAAAAAPEGVAAALGVAS